MSHSRAPAAAMRPVSVALMPGASSPATVTRTRFSEELMARKLGDKRAQFKSRVGVPGRYTARADRAATLFPLHLAPPPVLAPCTEAPLPEPEPPSAA